MECNGTAVMCGDALELKAVFFKLDFFSWKFLAKTEGLQLLSLIELFYLERRAA